MKKKQTNDGKKGGWLVGKRHYDKDGKSLGGIKAIVTDAGGKPVELEGGEVIINREASKKHWKELSRINQSAGNGVAIEPPAGAFDEDPEDNYEHGGKIEFNPNHVPSKMIVNYAKNIKSKHPNIWKLGGNIFGNEAFENLLRVSNRGYWLDSEEWMYIKWRAYVARHAKDFRIEGVVAMLKWCDKVDKGWAYMKQLIEEKIQKIDSKKGWKHKTSKMKDGGGITKWEKKRDEYVAGALEWTEEHIFYAYKNAKIYYSKIDNQWLLEINNKIIGGYRTLKIAKQVGEYYINNPSKMKDGGRTISQTPAPLKDRISGSKFNEKGSASTSSKASDIKFDDNTISSIQRLIDEHNEEHPSKKITLAVAKAVVRRGMGAYSSSHRPKITGGKPNSRTAWGLARLKAFIYKAQTGKSKSGNYSQDNDLFEELGISVQKMAEGGLIAPNGKASNLTPEQYKLVRTPAFKAWFGDWENDPKNASKVVDENGEPLVVYHGSKSFDINEFDISKSKRISSGLKEFGTYFTDNIKLAEAYKNWGELKEDEKLNIDIQINKWVKIRNDSRNNKDYGNAQAQIDLLKETKKGKIYGVFLNLKTMYVFDAKGEVNIEAWNNLQVKASYKRAMNRDAMEFLKDGKFGVEKVDGIKAENIVDAFVQTEELKKELLSNVFLVFDSKNIKLADGTNTTFDSNNPDIRYKDGGSVDSNVELVSVDYLDSIRTQDKSPWNYDLEKSIEEKGVEEPVVIGFWAEYGYVALLDGHHRLDTAIELGIDKIPAIVVDMYDDPHGKVKLYQTPMYNESPKKPSDLGIYKDGGEVDFGKVSSASSRFRPSETILFDPPLVGMNGNKLVSYTWKYEWTTDFSIKTGDAIEKRVSDWSQAETSADTGRNIVHSFTIVKPDGSSQSVSSESVPVVMGFVTKEQKKDFSNLATASKTLAKQQMQLSILEAKQKEYDEVQQSIIDAGYPEIQIKPWLSDDEVKLTMGDGSVIADANNPNEKERIEQLKDSYVRVEMQKLGINPYRGNFNYQIYELKKRIERQKRKVENIIDSNKMSDGGSVDAKDTVTLDIPLLIRTLELAREDIKSDAELHEMVERLLDLKNKPELTMDDYTYIADIEHKHLKPKMELGGNIEIEKLIAKAHDNLTRKRGRKEYAPTSHELQEEIDRMIMEDQFGSNNI